MLTSGSAACAAAVGSSGSASAAAPRDSSWRLLVPAELSEAFESLPLALEARTGMATALRREGAPATNALGARRLLMEPIACMLVPMDDAIALAMIERLVGRRQPSAVHAALHDHLPPLGALTEAHCFK